MSAALTSVQNDALIEIAGLVRHNNLTLEQVAAALKTEMKEEKSSGILTKIFGYIGGIFLFAGICIFIGLHWDEIGRAGHVMLTLGVGYCLFIMGVSAIKDGRIERAATPLFITAALLQSTGIMVALKEYGHGGDPAHAVLFMNAVMMAQYGLTFIALRRTFLAFAAIAFGASSATIGFDLLHVDHHLIGVTIGFSLTAVGWALANSPHRAIAGLSYFTGSAIFLSAAWDWLHHTPGEILFLGLGCGTIFLSTVARSRALLTVGTLATVGYIGDFTAEHFAHDNNWPFVLMFIGLILIGFSALAVKINKKYIAGK
jgi:uncharacterized membrane protein